MFNKSPLSKIMSLIMGTAGVGASAGVLVPWLTQQNKVKDETEKEREDDKDTGEEKSDEKEEEDSTEKIESTEEEQDSGESEEQTIELEEEQDDKGDSEQQMDDEDEGEVDDDSKSLTATQPEAIENLNPQNSTTEVASDSDSASIQNKTNETPEEQLKKGDILFTFLKFASDQDCITKWAEPQWKCKLLAQHVSKENMFLGFVFKTDLSSLNEKIQLFCNWVHGHAKAKDLGVDWQEVAVKSSI